MNNEQLETQWQSIGNSTELTHVNPEMPARSKAAFRKPTWENKLVLLVDTNSRTRESRAKIMRALGVTVHCAASAGTAHSRLATAKYNLVLVDLGRDLDGAELLAKEIKDKNPRQRVAFLVGRPLYVATSLKRDGLSRQHPPVESIQQKTKSSTVTGSDFGQKIRDAEAEQAAS